MSTGVRLDRGPFDRTCDGCQQTIDAETCHWRVDKDDENRVTFYHMDCRPPRMKVLLEVPEHADDRYPIPAIMVEAARKTPDHLWQYRVNFMFDRGGVLRAYSDTLTDLTNEETIRREGGRQVHGVDVQKDGMKIGNDASRSAVISRAKESPDGKCKVCGRGCNVVVCTLCLDSASDFLQQADQHMQDRASEYDKEGGERSMAQTITAFNAITGKSLTETEGWTLMLLLKQVRLYSRRDQVHRDSCEDSVAYAALQAESAVRNGV